MSTNQNFVQWSQPFLYDNGSSPAVAINDNGLCLEMHNGPSGNDGMFYRLGQYSSQINNAKNSPMNWTPVQYLGSGAGNPITCGLSNSFASMVYQDDDKNLFFQWAPLPANADGVLNWQGKNNYTSGEQPAMAMNGNSRLVAIHQDSSWGNYTMWYATGTAGEGIGGAAEVIQATEGSHYCNTNKVTINKTGPNNTDATIVVMSSFSEVVSLLVGIMQPNGSIVWGDKIVMDGWRGSFDVALDDDNNLLIASTISSPGGFASCLSWQTAKVVGTTVQFTSAVMPLFYCNIADTSVTINRNGNIILEICNEDGSPTPFQYFIGQAYFSQDYSAWMGQNNSTIGNIPLNLLAIPGTHDSGTYAITESSPITPDNPSSVLSFFAPNVATAWSISQGLDFLGQLNAGIRYFDIRALSIEQESTYITCHGFAGAGIPDLFNAIKAFYAQGGIYQQEIILLDMNHIYTNIGGVSWGSVDCWMPGGENSQFSSFCTWINNNIGHMLLPPALNGSSLNEIYNSEEYRNGGRIILIFDDGYSVQQNSNYWANDDNANPDYWKTADGMKMPPDAAVSTINSMWPNVTTLDALVSANSNNINNTLLPAWNNWIQNKHAPSEFTVLQCIGTEDEDIIKAGTVPTAYTPDSLQVWEAGVCTPYMFILANDSRSVSANIILVDWLEQTMVTPLCMDINRKKAALAATTGTHKVAEAMA